MTRERIAACIALCLTFTASCKGCSCSSSHVAEPAPPASRAAPPPKTDKEKDEEEEEADEEAKEEAEKAELSKPQFWRVKVGIVGNGFVTSYDKTLSCGNDGTHSGDACGATQWNAPIVGYKPAPSTLTALPATGWRLSSWKAEIHHANGRVTPRKKTSVRDFYINYFRQPYDANDFELVTAVFKPVPDGESPPLEPSSRATGPDAAKR